MVGNPKIRQKVDDEMSGILQKHIGRQSLLLFFTLITSISFADIPTTAPITLSVPEDQTLTISDTDFTFNDVDDDDFAGIRVLSLPLKGTLSINSNEVTTNLVIPIGDLQAGLLEFTPLADENGDDYASFQFAVIDASDEESDPSTITINVTPVNDPPTAQNNTLTLDKDASVTILPADFGFNDIDGHAFVKVIITNTVAAGVLQNGPDVVNDNDEIPYASLDAGDLVFTPEPDGNGSPYAYFDFRVHDEGEQSSDIHTITFNVNSINDLPTSQNKTITIPEDNSKTFSISDFPFFDADGDLLAAVRISNLNITGSLKLNSVDVANGDVISAANIPDLVFAPVPDGNGTNYASFNFEVSDGIAYSASTYMFTIDVTPVNDPPQFNIPATHSISESTGPHNVIAFATDIDDGDPEIQTLTFSIITGIPSGTLEFISAPEINVNTGNLTYEVKAKTNGSVVVEVTLADNGGTANGGIDRTTKSFTIFVTAVNEPPSFTLNGNPPEINEDAGMITEPAFALNIDDGDPELDQQLEFVITNVAGNLSFSTYPAIHATTGDLTYQVADNANGTATFNVFLREVATPLVISPTLPFTITVNAVNDPPEGNDANITLNEDQTYTFRASDFNFFDIDGHTFAGIQITSLPVKGDLRYNGSSVALGAFCPNVTLLTYTPAPNTAGIPYTSFSFKVRDSSEDLSILSYVMTINVIDIPDNPLGANSSVNMQENENHTFSVDDFPFNDPDGDAFNGIIIRTNVSRGSLQLNAVPITVLPATVNNVTHLVFLPVAGESGMPYTGFTFDVVDATGATSAGEPGSPYNMSINVGAVNDPPVGEDNTITILEDQTYTFKIDDFKFSDPDGHAFNGIQITQVETAGTLKYDGTDVVVLENYPDVTKLTYTPPSNQNGPALANFMFKVRDDSGELNISIASYTMTFNVTPVNDAPVFTITENPPTINEDAGPQTIAEFVSSIDDGDADEVPQLLTFNITVPVHPTLTFTQAPTIDVATGTLTYTPGPDAYGVVTISVVLSDDGGTANGGVDHSAAQEFTITVNPINDPPTLNDITGTYVVNEDAAAFIVNLAGISPGPSENQTITITTASSNEQIVPAPAVNYTSPSPTASLSVTPAANAFGVVTITVTVSDGQSSNSTVSKTFQVTVNPVNDPPTLDPIPTPAAILEDAETQTIDLKGIFAGPPNESQPLEVTAISNNQDLIPTASIIVNYTSPNSIGSISYKPLADKSGSAEITVIVKDDGTVNNTIERKFTVTVLPVNDPPTLALIADPAPILEDAVQQQIVLSGISAGINEDQLLSFSVESSNADLLTIAPIVYTQGASTAILRYTPNSNQFGTSIVNVTIDDGGLQNNEVSRQFRVVILPVADTPTVTDASTDQNNQTTSGLVISRNEHDGNEVQYFKITNIQNGQLFLQDGVTDVNNGEFITVAQGNAGLKFTPDSGDHGSFDVQASLENANSGLGGGVVTATIIVNTIPTVQNLPSSLTVDEDSPDIHFDLFHYFDDVEDPDIDLIFTVSNTAPGIVNVQVLSNILVISFLENQFGTAIITIRCTDTQGAFVEADIQLIVTPVNDAPVFVSMPVVSVEQGALYEYEIITSDAESDSRYFDWIAPAWLWLTDNGDGTAILTGTPENEDVGEVEVKITILESVSGLTASQEFTINVINVNDAPIFVSTPPLEVFETEKYEYQVEIDDPDPNDTYTVVIDQTTKPGWLVLTGGPGYVLEGFPPIGSSGNYTIKLIVFDAGGAASEQQFTITVSTPNNRPTITGNYNVTTDEDIPYTFVSEEFEARVQDPDASDSLAFIVITELPANGTLSVNGLQVHVNDTISVTDINAMVYTPSTDFFGIDYFDWKASDGKALSINQGRVNISVIPQNDPPRITNIETSPLVYKFGDLNVIITETAEVQEVDDGRIVSARFSVISNFNNTQDSLSIDVFDGIVSSWNDTTGVLSVTGIKNASVYQEIVRSLIYTNQNRFGPSTQTRTVQLTVFDGELESEPVIRNIHFEDIFVELFIPTGFTPNGDHANDTWQIDNIQEYDDAIVRVYSREGNLVYESIGQYKEWDGQYKGDYVKSGVYYFTIEIQKFEKKYSGTITVLR